MSEVNDPKESKFSVSSFSGGDSIDSIRTLQSQWRSFFQSRIKVACFSCDDPSIAARGEEHAFHGWAKPTMWAHYAENHKGVCVAFKRQKLLDAISKNFTEALRTYHGNVNYQEFVMVTERYMEHRYKLHRCHVGVPELEVDFDSYALNYLDKYCEGIYFRKHGDWSGEREYRLLIVSKTDGFEFLNYADSIEGICSGFAMEESVRSDVANKAELANIPHMRLYAQDFY